MKFSHRLAYYLLGLMIGCIFLKFVLSHTSGKGLEFDYLPNARVLKNIRNKPLDFSSSIVYKMKQQIIDTTDIKTVLTNGEVDFNISNLPFNGGKLYVIEGKTSKNKTIVLQIINYEDKVLLKDILNK